MIIFCGSLPANLISGNHYVLFGQQAACCPKVFIPVIGVHLGDGHAFGFGCMDKFGIVQVYPHMAGIGRWFEEHQVSGLQVGFFYRLSEGGLCPGGPGQIHREKILINGFDKSGAIDTVPAVAAQTVAGAPPSPVFSLQLLLNIR